MGNPTRSLVLAPLLLAVPACDDDGDDGGSTTSATDGTATDPSTTGDTGDTMGGSGGALDAPDIVGTYVENFPGGQGTHMITDSAWSQDFGEGPFIYQFEVVDNDGQFVVGEAGGEYSKLQWTYAGEDLYYCTVAFGAASADEAAATPAADDSDPANGGCGDFAWSLLEPA